VDDIFNPSFFILKCFLKSFFKYPEMMLSSPTPVTSASPTHATSTTTSSSQQVPSPASGQQSTTSTNRSPTPKSQTPVRNVFSVQPPLRAKTQVEVAQAALILSRIEDMKGSLNIFLSFLGLFPQTLSKHTETPCIISPLFLICHLTQGFKPSVHFCNVYLCY
jgi:hypothetical protein